MSESESVSVQSAPETPSSDAVNCRVMPEGVIAPNHYTTDPSGFECIEFTGGLLENLSNSIKYLWRLGKKDETEKEFAKSRVYFNWFLEGIARQYYDLDKLELGTAGNCWVLLLDCLQRAASKSSPWLSPLDQYLLGVPLGNGRESNALLLSSLTAKNIEQYCVLDPEREGRNEVTVVIELILSRGNPRPEAWAPLFRSTEVVRRIERDSYGTRRAHVAAIARLLAIDSPDRPFDLKVLQYFVWSRRSSAAPSTDTIRTWLISTLLVLKATVIDAPARVEDGEAFLSALNAANSFWSSLTHRLATDVCVNASQS